MAGGRRGRGAMQGTGRGRAAGAPGGVLRAAALSAAAGTGPGRSWIRTCGRPPLPAWQRAGVGPIGVFSVMIGADNPTFYVLLVHKTLDASPRFPSGSRPTPSTRRRPRRI